MKRNLKSLLVIALLPLVFISCQDQTFSEGKIFAGGQYVEAKDLNKGKMIYMDYCMQCHGVKGDGKGVASKGMTVPPRDFTQGLYKFGNVLAGELPTDEDIERIIKHGLKGTAMLPWDMSKKQIYMVWNYIKTFAPEIWEGKEKKLGDKIVPTKDPFGMAHKTSAIEKGKEVYHITAQCQVCHRAYATKFELSEMNKKLNGEPMTQDDFEDDMYKIKLQESEYNVKTVPPDFTWHHVRTGDSVEELYIRISAGVGGTSMPSWKETITDEEIWAVAHYINSLIEMKDMPARAELMKKLKNQ